MDGLSNFRLITLEGQVDTNNSTTSTLGAAGVFTGTATDISSCGIVFVNVYADQDSATDGLSIQQSSDGTNWDHSDDYTITAGTAKNYSINPHSRFMRVVYTNGGTIQGNFRLQTILKTQNAKDSSHRIKDNISGDDDCTLIKAALTGENGDGSWHNVKTTSDGYLSISDRSSGLAISKGDVTGAFDIHQFGNAPDFDQTDGTVDVWEGANDGGINQMVYQWSTTAAIDSISSANAGDTQTIVVKGLDGSFNKVEQSVVLNGQTRVALSTPLLRVIKAYNDSATTLAGNVYIYENTALSSGTPIDTTKIRCVVRSANNESLMAIYTAPAGADAYIRGIYASTAGGTKSSAYIIRLLVREYNSGTWKAWRVRSIQSLIESGQSRFQYSLVEPEKIPAQSDVRITVRATASGVTACTVSAGLEIVEIS